MNSPHVPFTAQLTAADDIAKDTKLFRFTSNNERELAFAPGQFFLLSVADKVFRSYSIASSPGELPAFDLIIKYLPNGQGSEYLWNLNVGDTCEFRGPMGRFAIQDAAKPQLFVATGTGLAPFRAMWQHLLKNPATPKVEVIFGVRESKNLFCIDEFIDLKNQYGERFDYSLCLSQPEQDAFDFKFFNGRVTDYLRDNDSVISSEKEISLCGSKPMVDEVKQILLERKFPTDGVNVESW
jgi:NAD(P)H-flavin reductase